MLLLAPVCLPAHPWRSERHQKSSSAPPCFGSSCQWPSRQLHRPAMASRQQQQAAACGVQRSQHSAQRSMAGRKQLVRSVVQTRATMPPLTPLPSFCSSLYFRSTWLSTSSSDMLLLGAAGCLPLAEVQSRRPSARCCFRWLWCTRTLSACGVSVDFQGCGASRVIVCGGAVDGSMAYNQVVW